MFNFFKSKKKEEKPQEKPKVDYDAPFEVGHRVVIDPLEDEPIELQLFSGLHGVITEIQKDGDNCPVFRVGLDLSPDSCFWCYSTALEHEDLYGEPKPEFPLTDYINAEELVPDVLRKDLVILEELIENKKYVNEEDHKGMLESRDALRYVIKYYGGC